MGKNRKRRGGKQHWSREYRKLIAFRKMTAILQEYWTGIVTEEVYRESVLMKYIRTH